MFLTHFLFEVRYWLRGWMVWIFLLVLGAMFFGAASSDQITVGAALGLIKLKPDRTPGAVQGWIYLHNEADYADDTVRKGFRALLKEAGGQQSIRRVTVPAGAYETGLQKFLEASGFTKEGTLREALYVHDAYHDVHLYGLSTETL